MSKKLKVAKATDPNFEETILRWFDESQEEFSDQDGEPESHVTTENVIKSDHDMASEMSANESDDQDEMEVTEALEDRDTTDPTKNISVQSNIQEKCVFNAQKIPKIPK